MAISTYAELLTAAANWTSRADLTSRIPEFVVLFESKFNREVRVPQQEKINASFSIDGEYETVPLDFIELRSIHITTDPKRPLSYLGPNQQTEFYNSGTGIPQFVMITGHTSNDGTMSFRFAPVPDGSYTGVMTYYAKLPALNSTTQTTNWLLTNHPDIYLYGILMEASVFMTDDQRIQAWRDGFSRALDSLQRTTNRTRWGAGGMVIRAQ